MKTIALLALAASAFSADLATKKALTLDTAKEIAAAAEAEARKNNWNVVIVIVDDGANLLYLQRMDGAQLGSIDVAIDKARTAIKFRRPTKALEDAVASGRNAVIKLTGAIPIEGGLPIVHETDILGAIGVSGVQSSQDAQVAKAGADAAMKLKVK